MENLFLLCFVHSSKLKKLSNRDIHQTYIYLLGWVMEEGGGGGKEKIKFFGTQISTFCPHPVGCRASYLESGI